MNVHQLRYRIELEKPGPVTKNPIGAVITSFESAGKYWAKKVHKSGSRTYDGDVEFQMDRVEYTIRPNEEIQPDWRIVDDGRSFQIISINRMFDHMVLVVDNSTSASTNVVPNE